MFGVYQGVMTCTLCTMLSHTQESGWPAIAKNGRPVGFTEGEPNKLIKNLLLSPLSIEPLLQENPLVVE